MRPQTTALRHLNFYFSYNPEPRGLMHPQRHYTTWRCPEHACFLLREAAPLLLPFCLQTVMELQEMRCKLNWTELYTGSCQRPFNRAFIPLWTRACESGALRQVKWHSLHGSKLHYTTTVRICHTDRSEWAQSTILETSREVCRRRLCLYRAHSNRL